MPIAYDPAILERFFGTAGEFSDLPGIERRFLFIDYQGPILKYSLRLDLEKEAAAVSGDPVLPFGGDSMFEFWVPCSEILEGGDGYRKNQVGLYFYYQSAGVPRYLCLMILKTSKGELKVWPAHPFPPGHLLESAS